MANTPTQPNKQSLGDILRSQEARPSDTFYKRMEDAPWAKPQQGNALTNFWQWLMNPGILTFRLAGAAAMIVLVVTTGVFMSSRGGLATSTLSRDAFSDSAAPSAAMESQQEKAPAPAAVPGLRSAEPQGTPAPGAAAGGSSFDTSIASPAGVYEAQLPAASSPGRNIIVTLANDGSVTWTTDYRNGQPPIVESGTWRTTPEQGRVVVELTSSTNGRFAQPDVITFQMMGRTLVMAEWDRSKYGATGITLNRRPG